MSGVHTACLNFLVPPSKVFLSATLANASEFAGWVAQLHQQPCHVVYTDYRPTPLQHFAFPIGGDGLYMVQPAAPTHCKRTSSGPEI